MMKGPCAPLLSNNIYIMGKMKELYAAMQEGYIEDLRQAYVIAESEDREVMRFQGQTISLTYAKYLLLMFLILLLLSKDKGSHYEFKL